MKQKLEGVQNNNLSPVVQWLGHRTLNPRTRVRFPVEEFFIYKIICKK
jgi:hypothetical protein